MLATAKEETPISPGLEFIPDSYQADPPFSGENAVELPDDNNVTVPGLIYRVFTAVDT